MRCKLNGSLMFAACMMSLLCCSTLGAGIEAGVGMGDCNQVKRKIAAEWFDLKGFFRPDGDQGLKRPRSNEFYCVSPAYIRDASRAPSRSAALSCYTLQGQKFCCDSAAQACAGM